MTVASGYLFSRFGMQAFWGMAALCAIALPLVRGIGPTNIIGIFCPTIIERYRGFERNVKKEDTSRVRF
jgi:hypothetical protein